MDLRNNGEKDAKWEFESAAPCGNSRKVMFCGLSPVTASRRNGFLEVPLLLFWSRFLFRKLFKSRYQQCCVQGDFYLFMEYVRFPDHFVRVAMPFGFVDWIQRNAD